MDLKDFDDFAFCTDTGKGSFLLQILHLLVDVRVVEGEAAGVLAFTNPAAFPVAIGASAKRRNVQHMHGETPEIMQD